MYFYGISVSSFISDSEYGLGKRSRIIVGSWLAATVGEGGLLCDTCGLENNHSSVEIGASEKEFSESVHFISDHSELA